jgi:DNA end-binding protein Ku
VVLRDREDIVLIAPYENAVTLYRLRSPQEIKNVAHVPQVESAPVEKEQLKLARSLIESMSKTLKNVDLTDKYHDALREMIEAKIEGKEIVTVEEEEAPVVDIMTALKQSIEQAKSQKKPMEKAKGEKKKAVKAKPVKSKKAKVA